MRLNKKSFILRIFIASIICFTLSLNQGLARIYCNGAGGGYGGDGESTDVTHGETICIENYILEGAGHFLRAKKDIQELLGIVELQEVQGLDFENINRAVDSALLNMNLAVETYDSLIAAAEATPYNETVLCKLRYFNYFGYMWEHGLNWIVFNRVKKRGRRGAGRPRRPPCLLTPPEIKGITAFLVIGPLSHKIMGIIGKACSHNLT